MRLGTEIDEFNWEMGLKNELLSYTPFVRLCKSNDNFSFKNLTWMYFNN